MALRSAAWHRTAGEMWARRLRGMARTEIFTEIYRKNRWNDPESRSGSGSTVAGTTRLRADFAGLVRELGVRMLLDAPCGDLNWMREVDLGGISYVGADIVPELIERNTSLFAGPARRFEVLDIVRDVLPRGDLILSRDSLMHLSDADALGALAGFRRTGSTWLLATTFVGTTVNRDIVTGAWRPINLELPRFGLPAPVRVLADPPPDGAFRDKSLGLWRLVDLASLPWPASV